MKKRDKKSELIVVYRQSESGGGIVAGQEDTDWPDYNTVYREHKLQGIGLKAPKRTSWEQTYDSVDVDFEPKNGDRVWLVRVVYDSGSTFGRSEGHVFFVAIYLDEDKADKLAKSIKDDSYTGYKPWQGYFGRLDYVEVTMHTVGDIDRSKRY